jgi:hypothetical protein
MTEASTAQREVCVLEDQLAHPCQVGGREVDQLEGSPCDLGQKSCLDLGRALQQPADLGDHGAGQQTAAES